MSSQLFSRSSYSTTSLSKADAYDVHDLARQAAKVTEVTKVASDEIAQLGAYAVRTMAELVQGTGNVRRQLMDAGHRSEPNDDFQSKILQVSGTNLITITNTAQKEIMQQTVRMMP